MQTQAAVLWCMQKGFFDPIAVNKVKEAQNKLIEFLETRKAAVLDQISKKGKIDEEIEKDLGPALEEFKSFNQF